MKRNKSESNRQRSDTNSARTGVGRADFPDLEDGYRDEHGVIDRDVYAAAQALWPYAERLAADLIYDTHLGVELMLRAAARVTSSRHSGTQILNIKFYLLRSYKNLLLGELEKENGRHRILFERMPQGEVRPGDSEDCINRKILINELRLEMDDWMREVFDLLVIGYAFEDLVPRYGSAANVIRSKFSKKLARFSRKLSLRF